MARALVRLLVFLSLAYLGLAYPLALFAGTSNSYRSWVAFGTALLILAPIVFLTRTTPANIASSMSA